MGYDLSDYVDVAERIRMFKAKYPDGFLRGDGEFVRNGAGEIIGYHYRAEAVTGLEGIIAAGTAYEPIPGKTTFTKDSEVQNAETSAWGRAIVALGFETKHIASANEVRNRSESSPAGGGERMAAAPSVEPGGTTGGSGGRAPLTPKQKKVWAKFKEAEKAGVVDRAGFDEAMAGYKVKGLSELTPELADSLILWLEARAEPALDVDLPF